MNAIIPLWLDLFAVGVGAMHGALFATKKSTHENFDIVGAITLAITVGLGGGILRDLFIGQPVAAMQSNSYLLTAVLVGFFVVLLSKILDSAKRLFIVTDMIALSLFTLVGVQKSRDVGIAFLPSIIAGVITAVGGGIARDLLASSRPQVMQRSTYYALAATIGSTIFVVGDVVGLSDKVSATVCVLCVLAARVLSLLLGVHSPEAHNIALNSVRRKS